jgi:molecular chaperone DnaK (HSP70)
MPAQFPQVDVTFLVDHNGMLTVTAKEQRSGVQAQVTVQPAHGLTREEVEQLVLESIEHAQEDFTARRLIELRNKAEADLRHTAKALAQAGDRLSPSQRQAIDTATETLQHAITQNDLPTLQSALDAFQQATLPLAEILMNDVLRRAVAGKTEQALDPNKL